MSSQTIHNTAGLSGKIHENLNISISNCYQCGKCTAGCPVVSEMDFPPSLLLHMLQAGNAEMDEKVLRSYTIWLCLGCETCIARCPQEVDIPQIMDFLRIESLKQKKANPKAKDIISFHKAFLKTLKTSGRLYEIGLIAGYKLRTWHFIQDILIAPKLFFKGKLGLFPHRVKGRKNITRIFEKTTG